MKKLLIIISLFPFAANSQTWVYDTTFFNNGQYILVKRNAATSITPTVSRLADSLAAMRTQMASQYATTSALPNMTNYATNTKLTDSLNTIRTSLAGKQPSLGFTPVANTVTVNNQPLSGNIVLGLTSGQGGVVTQLTNKATAVTLNKLAGEITLNAAALAAATIVSFTFTNSTIAATDVIILNHVTTGTRGAYTLNAQCAAGSAVIYVRNNTAGSLSEAIVIRYTVIKSTVN